MKEFIFNRVAGLQTLIQKCYLVFFAWNNFHEFDLLKHCTGNNYRKITQISEIWENYFFQGVISNLPVLDIKLVICLFQEISHNLELLLRLRILLPKSLMYHSMKIQIFSIWDMVRGNKKYVKRGTSCRIRFLKNSVCSKFDKISKYARSDKFSHCKIPRFG